MVTMSNRCASVCDEFASFFSVDEVRSPDRDEIIFSGDIVSVSCDVSVAIFSADDELPSISSPDNLD